MKPGIITVIFLSILIASCGGGGGGSPAPVSGQLDLSTDFDVNTASLPANGSLHVYVTLDGGSPQPMNISTNQASLAISGLSTGTHSVAIEVIFEYDNGASYTLASASTRVDVLEGSNALVVGPADYLTDYDDDNDGTSNLDELNAGLDPGNPADQDCVIGVSSLGGCVLG